MTDKPPYGWKDLFTDAAIIALVGGIVLVIVGSFPEFFGRFLPFLKQMPLNKLTPTKPEKDQPWKVWAFVIGLNLVAWVGWYFMHDTPSKW